MFVKEAKNYGLLMLAALVLVVATLACGETSSSTRVASGETAGPPTAAPTPSSLTFNNIERQHEILTDMQWEGYAAELAGTLCANMSETTLLQ